MDWIIHPSQYPVMGTLTLPGDKSISHRAMMLAALAEGKTNIHGLNEGEDCIATRHAFESMGVPFQRIDQQHWRVDGVGLSGLVSPTEAINCGNSGTTLRLLMGLLAGQSFNSYLWGDDSLMSRPMARVSDPLNLMGAQITTTEGRAPVHIHGIGEQLQGIRYTLPYPSAQLKSALLLAGLFSRDAVTVIEPQKTRDHTERMLALFGVYCQFNGVSVTLKRSVLKATSLSIPQDISAAAFFIVAALGLKSSRLVLNQLTFNPSRTGILRILKAMGAHLTCSHLHWMGYEPVIQLTIEYTPLRGINIPATEVPAMIDECPILFIAAALAKGKTTFSGLGELRHKESDRIAVMSAGLRKMGIEVVQYGDNVMIMGGRLTGGCVIDTYGDHRVAMAFVVAAACASEPVKLLNTQGVSSSFPGFQALASSVGITLLEQV